jgi:monoamine oxidase
MSRITQCAASVVGFENIRLNSRVDHIAYLDDGRVELSAQGLNEAYISTFDAVVIATPPSALHSIVDRPKWSFMKEQSIRGAHYEPLYKIGLHFRTRFESVRPSTHASAARAQLTCASAGLSFRPMTLAAMAPASCCSTAG